MTGPLDVWRVCGQPVTAARKSWGCTCGPNDPTPGRLAEALARLHDEQAEEAPVLTPHGQHPAAPTTARDRAAPRWGR